MIKQNRKTSTATGFTLIETLVALAISAVTLIALLSATHLATRGHTAIEQRFKAQIIAQYIMREIQLGLVTIPMKPYQYTQKIEMFNSQWSLLASSEKTAIPTALQINVEVQQPNSKAPLIKLVGYTEAN